MLVRFDVNYAPVAVVHKIHFTPRKVDIAALVALLLQDFGKFLHCMQCGHYVGVAFDKHFVAVKYCLHVVVGHAVTTANYRRKNVVRQHFAVAVYVHFAT